MKTICPYCRQSYEIDDEFNLQEGICDNCQKHFIIQTEPSEEKSFFLLDAQNSTAVSFFSQYMIYRQQCGTPQEKVTTIPLADIFVLELQETKDASGRITFSYHDPTESAVKNYYFRAAFTIYFQQDLQAVNRARGIKNYIQSHFPQCRVEYQLINEHEELRRTERIRLENERRRQKAEADAREISKRLREVQKVGMKARLISILFSTIFTLPVILLVYFFSAHERYGYVSTAAGLTASFLTAFTGFIFIGNIISFGNIPIPELRRWARTLLVSFSGIFIAVLILDGLYRLITPTSSGKTYHAEAPRPSNRIYYDDSSNSPSGRNYSQKDFNDAVDFVKKVKGKDLKEGLEQLRYGR